MSTAAHYAAEEAIARVSGSLTEDQRDDGILAVGEAALVRPTITTDDVDFELPEGVDPRAFVTLMRGAAKHGFIEITDEYRPSTSVTCHARPKRVWRSLLCKAA